MKRYTFMYKLLSTGRESQFSQDEISEDKARKGVKARIADFEMTDENDIEVGVLIKTSSVSKKYDVCESCSS